MADLEFAVNDFVATITLNRPHRKNAFTDDMLEQWAAILCAARADPQIRVVILTGAGDAFCSGVDLGKYAGSTPPTPLERKRNLTDRVHRVAIAVQDLGKPVIAAVRGAAVGAGMDMALMCDMRIASQTARFSEGYIKVGLVPGDGGCYYLPRLVGMAKAMELLLTGDVITGQEAARIGLVNHVVDDDALESTVTALARKIADAPPVAIQMITRATRQSADTDLRTALDLISSHLAVMASTEDSREAMQAFRERRPGQYHGR